MRMLILAATLAAGVTGAAAQEPRAMTEEEAAVARAAEELVDLARERLDGQRMLLLGQWHGAAMFLARCAPGVFRGSHAPDTRRRLALAADQVARVRPALITRYLSASTDMEASMLAADRATACRIAAEMVDAARTFLDELPRR